MASGKSTASDLTVYKKLAAPVNIYTLQNYADHTMKIIFLDRYSKNACIAKALYSPYGNACNINGFLSISLDSVEKLCEKLSKLDMENSDIFEVVFSTNTEKVCLESTKFGLSLKKMKGEATCDQNATIIDLDAVGDDAEPIEFAKKMKWIDEFYKVYFGKKDNVENMVKIMREFYRVTCKWLKDQDKEKEKMSSAKKAGDKRKRQPKEKLGGIDDEYFACITLMTFSEELNKDARECLIEYSVEINDFLLENNVKVNLFDIYSNYSLEELKNLYDEFNNSANMISAHKRPKVKEESEYIEEDEEEEEEEAA